MQEIIEQCLSSRNIPCFRGMDKDFFVVFITTLFYCSWKFRNSKIHDDQVKFNEVVIHFLFVLFLILWETLELFCSPFFCGVFFLCFNASYYSPKKKKVYIFIDLFTTFSITHRLYLVTNT